MQRNRLLYVNTFNGEHCKDPVCLTWVAGRLNEFQPDNAQSLRKELSTGRHCRSDSQWMDSAPKRCPPCPGTCPGY